MNTEKVTTKKSKFAIFSVMARIKITISEIMPFHKVGGKYHTMEKPEKYFKYIYLGKIYKNYGITVALYVP